LRDDETEEDDESRREHKCEGTCRSTPTSGLNPLELTHTSASSDSPSISSEGTRCKRTAEQLQAPTGYWIIPCRSPWATAVARLLTPSFRLIRLTCDLTVSMEMPSSTLTSRSVMPLATHLQHPCLPRAERLRPYDNRRRAHRLGRPDEQPDLELLTVALRGKLLQFAQSFEELIDDGRHSPSQGRRPQIRTAYTTFGARAQARRHAQWDERLEVGLVDGGVWTLTLKKSRSTGCLVSGRNRSKGWSRIGGNLAHQPELLADRLFSWTRLAASPWTSDRVGCSG